MSNIQQTALHQEQLQTQVHELQANYSFASESILELEKTVAKQQFEIQNLEKKLSILSEYVKTLKQDSVRDIRDETPPPHY